jgi:hypothetical protein
VGQKQISYLLKYKQNERYYIICICVNMYMCMCNVLNQHTCTAQTNTYENKYFWKYIYISVTFNNNLPPQFYSFLCLILSNKSSSVATAVDVSTSKLFVVINFPRKSIGHFVRRGSPLHRMASAQAAIYPHPSL